MTREIAMPRASWKGFLRLSLISCPVYLSPGTTRTKAVRLRQFGSREPSDSVADRRPKPMSTRTRHGRGRLAPDVDDEPVSRPSQWRQAAPIALRDRIHQHRVRFDFLKQQRGDLP